MGRASIYEKNLRTVDVSYVGPSYLEFIIFSIAEAGIPEGLNLDKISKDLEEALNRKMINITRHDIRLLLARRFEGRTFYLVSN